MRKEFRFLLQSARINLALVAGYAAVLTLGAILFPAPVIYALSDFLIMILSWLVKQSLRAFLFQEVQP